MSAHPSPSGDTASDLTLITEMRPALVRYFTRKTGSTAEAEDLAQDVLLRALIHAKWKSPAAARGYIFRIAVNRWRDRYRRQRVHGIEVAWDDNLVEESDADNPLERVFLIQEELNQILHVLAQLSVRTRTVIMLVKLEQMRIATVAEMLGISVSAVNKHLAKGLAALAAPASARAVHGQE